MSMRLAIGFAVLAAATAGAGTDAAQRTSGTRMRFAGMDTNQDGVITRDEWRGSDRAFRRFDLNGDGVLSGPEVLEPASDEQETRGTSGELTAGPAWTDAEFTRLDRDGNGRITQQEWPYSPGLLTQVDRNGDGVLSRAEFLGSEDTTPARRFDFDAADTNHDGVISRSEWEQVFGRSGRQSDSRAYQAGYERGMVEGREAGREDNAQDRKSVV